MLTQEQKYTQMTQAISDGLTLLCAIPIQIFVLRKLPKQDGSQNQDFSIA